MAEPEPEKLVCKSCCYSYKPEEGRVHGKCFQCTTCSSSERVLRNNLGEKHGLNSFSGSEACKFFRDIHKKKKEAKNGRLSWTTLKGVLVTALTDKRMETFKNTVTGTELPLEVWLSQGWRRETVEAQPNFYSKELGCQVYKVPIRATSWSEEHYRIQEEILRHEQEAYENKKGKKRRGQAEQNSSDGEMALPADESKAVGRDEKKEEKDRKLTLSKNIALSNRAAKAMGPLQSTLTALEKGKEKVEKASVQLPEGTMASVDQCITTLRAWAEASRSCVNAQEATRSMDALQLLPSLPYDGSDLKALQQQAHVLQQSMRDAVPKKEPKGKAKAKAVSTPLEEAAAPNGSVAEAAPKRRRVKSAAAK